jgi:two-component system, OmpR family, sensor histidine kinase VicK
MNPEGKGTNTTGRSSTEVIVDPRAALSRGVEFMAKAKEKMDIFFDKTAASIVVGMPEYREGYQGIRNRGGKIRAFTEIVEQNLEQCRELAKLVDELHHVERVTGGIAVTESEYMATLVLKENTPLSQVIYSNDTQTVEQGQQIFNEMWRTSVPADVRIQELEKSRQSAAPQ